MTHQVMPNLSFGSELACTNDATGQVAVVHACKDPCHRSAVGYGSRKLATNHPNYLVLETDYHLFLNLIDPPAPLFQMPSFEAFFAFVDKHIEHREVVIHCNQGQSRAPSLALLYAAKHSNQYPAESYAAAAQAFRRQFPYDPGRGIQSWLTSNWAQLG